MEIFQNYAAAFILVFSFIVQLEAVTVDPLAPMCPTNKIAPRRRRGYDNSHPRTFGEFYSLLAHDSPGSLQEKPQEDVPDDCGEIEEYDENDISSVTPQSQRRKDRHHGGYHKGSHGASQGGTQGGSQGGSYYLLTQHYNHGVKPPTIPPNRPTRPPHAGYFGTNSYTPPTPQEPTDYVKPVNEAGQDPHVVFRPGTIVGAPLGHVFGFPQPILVKPPVVMNDTEPDRKPKYFNHAYVPINVQSDSKHYRQRKFSGNSGIIGSFVDLFF